MEGRSNAQNSWSPSRPGDRRINSRDGGSCLPVLRKACCKGNFDKSSYDFIPSAKSFTKITEVLSPAIYDQRFIGKRSCRVSGLEGLLSRVFKKLFTSISTSQSVFLGRIKAFWGYFQEDFQLKGCGVLKYPYQLLRALVDFHFLVIDGQDCPQSYEEWMESHSQFIKNGLSLRKTKDWHFSWREMLNFRLNLV